MQLIISALLKRLPAGNRNANSKKLVHKFSGALSSGNFMIPKDYNKINNRNDG